MHSLLVTYRVADIRETEFVKGTRMEEVVMSCLVASRFTPAPHPAVRTVESDHAAAVSRPPQ